MKKNLNKFLSRTLLIYYFLLAIIVILKLIGIDYFALDTDNEVLLKINDFLTRYHLTDVYYAFTLMLYAYVMISISCDDCSKRIKKYTICLSPILIGFNIISSQIDNVFFDIFTGMFLLYFVAIAYSKVNKISIKKTTINYIKIFIITMVFQFISIFIRSCSLYESHDYGFIVNAILDVDYLILSFIYYEIHFNGGEEKCLITEVGSFSQKHHSSTSSLRKSQIKSLNSKEKFEFVLSFILILLWNCFTVAVVLFIAMLNDTIIECIFILVSFWCSKFCFGKPFHFKSVIQCFIVSNLTYYALNRITMPIGISIIIPIILGVGLSYITARKTINAKLYKGMPEEELYQIVRKVSDDEIAIKICKEYYCDRLNDTKIARINNYSIPSIRLKRQTINNKLKRLES